MRQEQALSLLPGRDWRNIRLGLDRVRELLRLLGNPQEKLRFLHVAGTNGKGSVSSMLSSVLTEAGYRTGLYISPHLEEINERWSVNGAHISDARLSELLLRISDVLSRMEDKPTEFEALTALAFLYFAEEQCELVVLEVGMGGRLDATNVISAPECAVIMNIGLEHTEYLGGSLREIAAEKGGIIKRGCPVVLYHQSEEAEESILKCCLAQEAALRITDPSSLLEHPFSSADLFQCFDYRDRKGLRLPLLGSFQCRNAAVLLDTLDVLQEKGYEIPESAIRRGLEKAVWPGRFEVISRDPLVIVDGAHNPNGAEALAESIRRFLPGRRILCLMGVMRDKDYRAMLRHIAPYASRFIAEVPENARALEKEVLAAEIRAIFPGPVETADSVKEGLQLGLLRLAEENQSISVSQTSPGEAPIKKAEGAVLLCFGSLYQVAAIRKEFSYKSSSPSS